MLGWSVSISRDNGYNTDQVAFYECYHSPDILEREDTQVVVQKGGYPDIYRVSREGVQELLNGDYDKLHLSFAFRNGPVIKIVPSTLDDPTYTMILWDQS